MTTNNALGKFSRAGGSTHQAQRIAVVGSGISGLSAAWLLNKRHDVTVYEQNGHVGGHSNTAQITVEGKSVAVDTGFIVYNPVNYPNLVALFDLLGVPNNESNMTFSASLRDGALEYAGSNLNGLLAQRTNVARPRFLMMVKDLLRFYREAPELIDRKDLASLSLGDFLQRNGYGQAFINDHLIPMGAAIWSSSAEQMLSFPTLSFLRFFNNHGLVQLKDRPQWRTVTGGSREYVRRLSADFAHKIRRDCAVTRVVRSGDRCDVHTDAGIESYDQVIMACHADEALKLLDNPTSAERRTLGRFSYQPNTAVLHSDQRLMPRRKRAWASWNYIGTGAELDDRSLCVTYWMNSLQNLTTDVPIFVTLNPARTIDPEKVFATYDYAHPVFDAAANLAQRQLWDLQGKQRSWFCGAYFGSGFHEDGIQAGLEVAEMLGGIKRPWIVPNASARVRHEEGLLTEIQRDTEAA